jgi:RHS repeat-associated protein
VWAQPTDTGLEFGATFPDALGSSMLQFAIDLPAGVTARLEPDSSTILERVTTGPAGVRTAEFAGRIAAPVLMENGGQDGAIAITDRVKVELVAEGNGTYRLRYRLDPDWFHASDRVFPIVLDPTICLRPGGGSGCTDSAYLNTYIGDGSATHASYPTSPSTLRVGYDAIGSPDAVWDQLRSLIAFDAADLTDGQQVSSASLILRQDNNREGNLTPRIVAKLLSKQFASTSSWDSMSTRTVAGHTSLPSSGVAPCGSGTADCNLTLDVTAIVAATHSKNAATWKAGYGFMVQQVTESSSLSEVDFHTGENSTVTNRPRLSVTYVTPSVGFDFDATLGATYSPSSMVKGVSTILPVIVENKTGSGNVLDRCTSASDADCYELGYRWFNAKGKLVSSTAWGPVDLPASSGDVSVGERSDPVGLPVMPPSAVGQYSLRLDLVHRLGGSSGTRIWASDFADPSKYYKRNKKVLASDSTRWVGTSAIERAEFGITVGSGDAAGERRGTDGLGIDLATRNLSYHADTGLGFADLLPVGLEYAYNSVDAAGCAGYQGILGACGWSTPWDERITGGQSATGYDYTYQAADGTRYLVDTDGAGQLTSGAPVLLERERVTFADEVKPSGSAFSLVDAGGAGFTPFYGTYTARTGSGANAGLGTISSTNVVNLNAYPRVAFAMRTSAAGGATSSGLCFKIHNTSSHLDPDQYPDRWYCYTTGTAWNPGSFDHTDLGLQSGVSSLSAGWNYYSRNLYDDIRTVAGNPFGNDRDDYEVIAVQVQSAGANSNDTYLDAARFEPADSGVVDPDATLPSWTSGGTLVSTSPDHLDGGQSLRVGAAAYGSSPLCDSTGTSPCWSTSAGSLWGRPFASWAWKKVGGSMAAISFRFKDEETDADKGWITYYAGPAAPSGAPNPVQVSPTVPTSWTLVTRNFREDARQILGIYTDKSTKSRAAGPDDVRLTGYRIAAGDGNFLLLSAVRYTSLPSLARTTRTGSPDEYGLPSAAGSTAPTYDFRATSADGTVHYFNEKGFLARITDLDGNSLGLAWRIDASRSGQDAFTLARVRAAADGSALTSGTAARELVMTKGTDGTSTTLRFDEVLGSTTSDASSRAATFYVATGSGDLVTVAPARVTDQACSATPSGCSVFAYTDGTNHRLAEVRDPRYTGGSGSGANFAIGITWSSTQASGGGANPAGDTSTNPVAITDIADGKALLKVVRWDNAPAGSLYRRPLFSDVAALAAGNYAAHLELAPDGAARATYAVQACGGSCAAAPPAGDTATLGARRTSTTQFDGLAKISTTTTYRCNQTAGSGCTGTTDLVSVTRQGSNAGAKVDNYANPLAGGGPAWTQDADQSFASLRDSGGTNPDLYRTEYRYDGYGQLVDTVSPVFDGVTAYAGAVSSTYYLSAHYRLGGNALDAKGSYNGTASNVTYAAGGLTRDTNQAAVFNGSNSKVTSTLGISTTGYTLEAWVKVATAGHTGKGIVGDWASSTGALLYLDGSGAFALVHNGTYVRSTIVPAVGRWYHAVATWDGSIGRIYIDGTLVAAGTATGATGAGATSLEMGSYSNGTSTTFLSGSLDEVAVYWAALDDNRVRAHHLAGRGLADRHSAAAYDREGHVTEVSDQFLANPGFESGLASWQNGSAAAAYFASAMGDPNVHEDPDAPAPSYASLNLTNGAYVNQDMVLLPGQRFRVQFWARVAAGGAHATRSLYYWDTTTNNWGGLVNTYTVPTTWTQYAYDVVIPMNSDGRIRLSLWNDPGSGTVYFDDVVVVTDWSGTSYSAAGLPTDSRTLAPSGWTRDVTAYAASLGHPAIFPTATTAVYADGVYTDSVRDEDVTTSTTYDAWGRTLVVTDPDGLVSPTPAYAANQTDVTSTTDALGGITRFEYDAAGLLTRTTSPSGLVTSTTYNRAGQAVAVTAADGTVTATTYDRGLPTGVIANYVDGAPADDGGHDDLLTTTTYDPSGRPVRVDADCGAAGACTTNGGIDAVTEWTYDLTGNTVTTTAWDGGGTTGTGRTTTSYFETYTYTPIGGTAITLTRMAPSGTRAAVAPSAAGPAPVCPGTGSGTPAAEVRCTSAHVAQPQNGVLVPGTDMNGGVVLVTDAYGFTSRQWADLAGRTVRTVVNYEDGVYADTARDRDLISGTVYTITGLPQTTTDPANRGTSTTYDRLGRATKTTTLDSARAAVLATRTIYAPSGRIERTSSTEAASTTDDSPTWTWTRTLYDALGRATTTLANYDISGNAGLTVDGFETGTDGWTPSNDGEFVKGASEASVSADEATVRAGNASLQATTSAQYAGAGLNLPGTWLANHHYHLTADINPSSTSVGVLFGRALPGGDYAQTSTGVGGGWQHVDVVWTPSATTSSSVRVAFRQAGTTSGQFWIDNVTVYDEASVDRNIPTETAYDADGRVIRSVLPPGEPDGAPMTTETAYDALGRPVVVSVAVAGGSVQGLQRWGSATATGIWPLDELAGTTARRYSTPGTDLTYGGSPHLGIAGATDEAQTAVDFDGVDDSVYGTGPTISATAYSIEAWVRSDDSSQTDRGIAGRFTTSSGVLLRLAGSGEFGVVHNGTAVSSGFHPAPGVWHHVVATWDGTTERIYVDGALKAASAVTGVPGAGGATFEIGAYGHHAAGTFLKGAIDDVALYSTAMPAADVLVHFERGRRSDASNLTTRTAYDALGRATDTWNPRGIRTHAAYDRLGRRTATIANYDNGTPTDGDTIDDDAKSTFAYNATGELLAYCPARAVASATDLCDPTSTATASNAYRSAWHYTYDAMGRQTRTIPPVNTLTSALNTSETVYEAGGRVARTCSYPAGSSCTGTTGTRTTTPGYDALGRTTSTVVTRTGLPTLTTTTTYARDGQVESTGDGSSDTLTTTYDTSGRPLTLYRVSGQPLTALTYNPDGTVATRTDRYADGTTGTTTFGHDWAGRVTSASSTAIASESVGTAWRLDGLLASRTYPTTPAETLALAYDDARRPERITLAGGDHLDRTYDRAGNVTSEGRSLTGIAGDAGSGTQAFLYDDLGRLTGSSGLAVSKAYRYDLDGNRVYASEGLAATTTYTFDRTDMLVAQDDGTVTAFTYDAFGNMTRKATGGTATTDMAYDAADRLVSVTPSSGPAATFTLDALGRPWSRTLSPGATDTYAYLGTTETVAEVATSGAPAVRSLLDPDGSRLALRTGTAAAAFTLFDQLGSLVGLLGPDRTITSATRFDGWGETLAHTGTTQSPWGFRGHLDLSPTGDPLYAMGARFYAPSLGAFTQLDTYAGRAAHPASMNRFLYAEANPATLIDPTGHMVPVESAYCDPALHACGATTKGGTGGTSSGTGGTSGGTAGSGATQWSPVPVKPVAPVVVAPVPPTSPDRLVCDYTYTDRGDCLSLGQLAQIDWGQRELSNRYSVLMLHLDPEQRGAVMRMTAAFLQAHPEVYNARVTAAADQQFGLAAAGMGASFFRSNASSMYAEGPADVAPVGALSPIAAARAEVAAAVRTAEGMGPVALTRSQAAAALRKPYLEPMFTGYNFHQRVAQILQAKGHYKYNYGGPDFTNLTTRTEIELTTPGQVNQHLVTYPWLVRDQIVTYTRP